MKILIYRVFFNSSTQIKNVLNIIPCFASAPYI